MPAARVVTMLAAEAQAQEKALGRRAEQPQPLSLSGPSLTPANHVRLTLQHTHVSTRCAPTPPCMQNDMITMSPNLKDAALLKLSISFALGQVRREALGMLADWCAVL